MRVEFLKCKIHRATVTDANLEYEGSITLGSELMEAAGLREFEKVEVYNISNGERFCTYALRGSQGTVCINGAAAWKAKPKDRVIIASYCALERDEIDGFRPSLVFVGPDNEILRVEEGTR